MKLYLPRLVQAGASAELPTLKATGPVPAARGETVLVVEDEPLVRQFSADVLRDVGYDVLEAGDGPAALVALHEHRTIELLFTDVVLTGPMNRRRSPMPPGSFVPTSRCCSRRGTRGTPSSITAASMRVST